MTTGPIGTAVPFDGRCDDVVTKKLHGIPHCLQDLRIHLDKFSK